MTDEDEFPYLFAAILITRDYIQATMKAVKFVDEYSGKDEKSAMSEAGMLWTLLLIHVATYLEGLDKCIPFFEKDDKRELLEAISMIKERTNQDWPDIRYYRNKTIAHPHYDDKKNESILKSRKAVDFRIPQGAMELTWLGSTVLVIDDLARKVYPELEKRVRQIILNYFEGAETSPVSTEKMPASWRAESDDNATPE